MLLLNSTTEKLQLETGSAGMITVDVSYADNSSGTITFGPSSNLAAISSATTTDIVAAPGNGVNRNVLSVVLANTHASVTNALKLQSTDGTNVVRHWAGSLAPGELLRMDEGGQIVVYNANGLPKSGVGQSLVGISTSQQASYGSSDTYVTGSYLRFPTQPRVGTKFKITFDITKTAAGTATPVVTARIGTAGTTSDTSVGTLTGQAGTAAASTAKVTIEGAFRAVGSGTSAIVAGTIVIENHGTTGIIGAAQACSKFVSSGFDSTVANLGVGVSFNGGASFVGTTELAVTEITNC